MATHSSMLAWEIPWIEENGGLQSMGLQRAGHDRAHTEKQKKWHGPKSSGESAGSQLQPAGVWQETRPQPDPTAISSRTSSGLGLNISISALVRFHTHVLRSRSRVSS